MTKVELMQKLLQEVSSLKYGASDTTSIVDKAKLYIKKCFGEDSDYLLRIDSISFHPFIFSATTPESTFVKSFNRGKEEFKGVVKTMIEDLELSVEETLQTVHYEDAAILPSNTSKKVFIVHGHDETRRVEIEAFLRSIDYEPIVLFKEPNRGKTIIEKIEDHANDVCYAIVLYTPCDLGHDKKVAEEKPRARQNVVFEHGYMCAKLGRDHVCALYTEDVELPGDMSGVVYTKYDNAGLWKYSIAKEMNAVELKVDMNKIR